MSNKLTQSKFQFQQKFDLDSSTQSSNASNIISENNDDFEDISSSNTYEEEEDDKDDSVEQNPFTVKSNSSKSKKSKTPVLDNFGRDLTAFANEGKLDPIVGRKNEIERVSQILSRRKKNNPLLIGEPGVGKSAIAEGLAIRIIERKVSRLLYNKRVI